MTAAFVGLVVFSFAGVVLVTGAYHGISMLLDEHLDRFLERTTGNELSYKYIELGVLFASALIGAITGIVLARKKLIKARAKQSEPPHALD